MTFGKSNGHMIDDVTYVTLKGKFYDLNTLRAQYLENSWKCYVVAAMANY